MQKLLKFLKPYRLELIIGPCFKLLEAIFELIVPVVMAKIIDNGIANQDENYIFRMCGLIVILGICGLSFALTCQYFAARCAFRYGADLRKALYEHINSLSETEIDRLGTSTLINRITNDVTASQAGVNMFIRLASRAPFLLIGAVVMVLIIDAKLALLFLIIAPIVALLLYFVMNKTIPLYTRNQKKLDNIARHTGENLDGIRVIRAFARQKQETQAF
ncbi:MAG: ABC transporter ATP-binding protein, partial [Oscillospiraceae bacterium]|nr:ABC transporter ATP-binding protein [Oscillospiraceae bacterium]